MASIASPAAALVMLSLNASVGAAAQGTTLTDSTWKLRSGIGFSTDGIGAGSQVGEEAADLCPYFGSAGEASPVGAGEATGLADAVDEERFDVGAEQGERGVTRFNLVPRFEGQEGFDCSGRTG